MKNFWKTGILTLTLVMPVLLLVLLYLTGENQYKLPKFFPKEETRGKIILDKNDTLYVTVPVSHAISIANLFLDDSIVNKKVVSELTLLTKENLDVGLIEPTDKSQELKEYALKYMESEAKRVGKSGIFKSNGKLLLIDKNGNVRGVFNGIDLEEIERLNAEIKVLREIQKNEKQ